MTLTGLNILTFSGWTQPADALLGLAPNAIAIDYADHQNFDEIADNLPQNTADIIIGWSLGGIIARNLLSSGALKASALISLSSPYQFVKNDHMNAAMPPNIFEQFNNNYANDTERTVQRFHGLVAKGDAKMRSVLDQLEHHPTVHETHRWLPWMDFLRNYSSNNQSYDVPPTLVMHGAHDAIVPAEQSHALAEKLAAKHIIMPEAGHALHLHDKDKLMNHISEFLEQTLDTDDTES